MHEAYSATHVPQSCSPLLPHDKNRINWQRHGAVGLAFDMFSGQQRIFPHFFPRDAATQSKGRREEKKATHTRRSGAAKQAKPESEAVRQTSKAKGAIKTGRRRGAMLTCQFARRKNRHSVRTRGFSEKRTSSTLIKARFT